MREAIRVSEEIVDEDDLDSMRDADAGGPCLLAALPDSETHIAVRNADNEVILIPRCLLSNATVVARTDAPAHALRRILHLLSDRGHDAALRQRERVPSRRARRLHRSHRQEARHSEPPRMQRAAEPRRVPR